LLLPDQLSGPTLLYLIFGLMSALRTSMLMLLVNASFNKLFNLALCIEPTIPDACSFFDAGGTPHC